MTFHERAGLKPAPTAENFQTQSVNQLKYKALHTKASMNIQHSDNGFKGEFYIASNGETQAKMTYVWVGASEFIIDHTEVGDALRGQGAGKELVAQAVTFAREKQVKIIPLCPFAKSVFDKTPEYSDVLVGK